MISVLLGAGGTNERNHDLLSLLQDLIASTMN